MKVALYGVWHVHAKDYTKAAREYTEVVGAYDADEARRKEFCAQYNLKEFTTPEELLASEAEGVIVCSASHSHADDMIKIAAAGKHIFTEKVLALTDEDCERIEKAVNENGVQFVISMPQKFGAGQLTMKKIVDSGELGTINYLRFRNCHSGSIADWLPVHFYNAKECGGGAMIDLGAHGMYLTEWLLGMPDSFVSTFTHVCDKPEVLAKNTDRVEDNAVTVMTYKNGCIAINETGFVSMNYPPSLEIGGDKGYARMEGGPNLKVTKATTATEGKTVEVPLEEARPLPIVQFVTGNAAEGCSMKEAKALTHMMVKAYENIQ